MTNNISKSNAALLARLAEQITSQSGGDIIKVGIDGFCASGKTSIANELGNRIEERRRSVIRASTDDFQNPPEIRWRKGQNSPLGFYQDSIDWDSVEHELLMALNQKGDKWYRTSTYDIHRLVPNYSKRKKAAPGAVLIFDGLFLQIPRLRSHWNLMIYADASYDTCILRAKERNQEQMDSKNEIEQVYRDRYIPGFELYIKEVNPIKMADIIINTKDY